MNKIKEVEKLTYKLLSLYPNDCLSLIIYDIDPEDVPSDWIVKMFWSDVLENYIYTARHPKLKGLVLFLKESE